MELNKILLANEDSRKDRVRKSHQRGREKHCLPVKSKELRKDAAEMSNRNSGQEELDCLGWMESHGWGARGPPTTSGLLRPGRFPMASGPLRPDAEPRVWMQTQNSGSRLFTGQWPSVIALH